MYGSNSFQKMDDFDIQQDKQIQNPYIQKGLKTLLIYYLEEN